MLNVKLAAVDIIDVLYSSVEFNDEKALLIENSRDSLYRHKRLFFSDKQVCFSYPLKASYLKSQNSFLVSGEAFGIIEGNVPTLIFPSLTTLSLEDLNLEIPSKDLVLAKIYSYMYLKETNNLAIKIDLSYFLLGDETDRDFFFTYTFSELESNFMRVLSSFTKKYFNYKSLRISRSSSLSSLEFPFNSFKENQREVASEVYRAVQGKYNLYINLPRGSGSTFSVLFSSIKALLLNKDSKIFYLTDDYEKVDKVSSSVKILKDSGLHAKTCFIEDFKEDCFLTNMECDSNTCRFAKGFYDRYLEYRENIIKEYDLFDRESLVKLAKKYSLCHAKLSREIASLSDIVITSYASYFNYKTNNESRNNFKSQDKEILIIDESTEFINKLRKSYSSSIDLFKLKEEIVLTKSPSIKESLTNIVSNFEFFFKDKVDGSSNLIISSEFIDSLLVYINLFEKEIILNKPYTYTSKELYVNIKKVVFLYENYFSNLFIYMNKLVKTELVLMIKDVSKILNDLTSNNLTTLFLTERIFIENYSADLLGKKETDKEVTYPPYFMSSSFSFNISKNISLKYKARDEAIGSIINLVNNLTNTKKAKHIILFNSLTYLNKVFSAYKKTSTSENIYNYNSYNILSKIRLLNKINGLDNTVVFSLLDDKTLKEFKTLNNSISSFVVVGSSNLARTTEENLLKEYYSSRFSKGNEYSLIYSDINKIIDLANLLNKSSASNKTLLLIDNKYIGTKYKNIFNCLFEKVNVLD